MAIAATWTVNGTAVTTSASLATVSNTIYQRDLVITNGGPSNLFVALGTGCTVATTAGSMQIPAGGSLILTQCQVPSGGIIFGVSSGTSATSIGYASLVNYT